MKKLFAFALAPLMLLGMVGCGGGETPEPEAETTLPPVTGFVVPKPMRERPDYSVPANPTVQQLRETAVRAMQDMLSIQWSTDEEINYNKTGAVSHKNYHYDPNSTYCGLPYADGQTNIYTWLEYYDYRSGQMRMEGDGQWLNKYLGNTCAGSLMWAWSTVCDSLTGPFINYNMVPMYGCIPVGDYKCDVMNAIKSWKDYPTKKVCEENGSEKIFECYALIQMADAVTSTTPEHTMMAIENAVVVRDADGKIDPVQSYIMVQDQAAGTGDKFFEHTDDTGYLYQYTGRTGPIALKCTFQWLFEKHYIPVTTVELAGKDPYAKAEVEFSKEDCADVDSMMKGTVSSNYPMCVLKIHAKNEKGKTTQLFMRHFNRVDVGSGLARSYGLFEAKAETLRAMDDLGEGKYTICMEVTTSTGEVFTPVQVEYKK